MELPLIFLILALLVSAFPAWPYSRRWGYGPSGLLGLTLMFFLTFLLL